MSHRHHWQQVGQKVNFWVCKCGESRDYWPWFDFWKYGVFWLAAGLVALLVLT